jgi:hypothetical protein
MRTIIAALTLAAAATALPNHLGRSTTAATLAKFKGFYLTARVTDPAHDLDPSVDNWVLGTIHTGAGLNAAVFSTGSGRLFYENGTAEQVANLQTTIVTDGGTPPFPSSLMLQGAGEPRRIGEINVGYGTANSVVAEGENVRLVNGLGEGTYLACTATVPYYNQEFVTLQYLYGKVEVPEGCAPVELVPRCATLNELPEGSLSSHEFAVEVDCVA